MADNCWTPNGNNSKLETAIILLSGPLAGASFLGLVKKLLKKYELDNRIIEICIDYGILVDYLNLKPTREYLDGYWIAQLIGEDFTNNKYLVAGSDQISSFLILNFFKKVLTKDSYSHIFQFYTEKVKAIPHWFKDIKQARERLKKAEERFKKIRSDNKVNAS